MLPGRAHQKDSRRRQPPPPTNNLSVAAAESVPAHNADQLRAIIRHARIPREHAAEFWDRQRRRRGCRSPGMWEMSHRVS
jgi:hypothetical protein